jgi:NADPH-dependent 2,4-dienoyl-CoA reductase/sulfur reductase-like enzyme
MHYTMALATPGATAKRLHLDGADLQNIFTLRSAADAASICADLQAGTRVVIVGSSFIGLEVASSLRARDLAVTIIAQEEIPFLRQFGSAIGQMFKALHEENGVRFVSKSPLARFEGDGGKVRSAVLEDGAVLPADLVIIGVGVQPATDFLQGVDRTEDGGIKVDRGMRAAEGLYVAGDAASFPFGETLLRIEHWRVAQQHARVAARNMLGETAEYDAVPFFWTYHYGRRFEYLGHASEWDEVVVDGSLAAQNFLAFLVSGGMVAAVVACQRERDTARLADRMRHPLAVDEARRLITDRS